MSFLFYAIAFSISGILISNSFTILLLFPAGINPLPYILVLASGAIGKIVGYWELFISFLETFFLAAEALLMFYPSIRLVELLLF